MSAGRDVRVTRNVAGDVAAAGSEVTVDGDVGGYVMSAGRHVRVNGRVGNDVWAAGETVTIANAVGHNVMAAGRTVDVLPTAVISGNARLAGQTVRSEGRVARHLRVAGSTVSIGGEVGGSVSVRGDRINVLPGAVIRGDFTTQSATPPDVSAQAQILGVVRHRPSDANGTLATSRRAWVWWFTALLLVGGVALLVAPAWPREVAGVLRARPGATLIAGILVLLLVPALAVAVAITVVGIPLAILALGLYVALLILSLVLVSYRLGEWILARLTRSPVSRWAPLAVGVLVFSLAMSLPVVGGLVSLLALVWGTGAIYLERRASVPR